MRVFLDANILLSASVSQSLTGKFLGILGGIAELVTSTYCIRESRKNIHKFRNSSASELDALVSKCRVIDAADREIENPMLPPKDFPVLTAAIQNGCTHLVTGDLRHFGKLMNHPISGLKVVTLSMLAEEIGLRPSPKDKG